MDAATPVLSVAETRDGVWSVNERSPSRVAVVERDGTVRLARDYTQDSTT